MAPAAIPSIIKRCANKYKIVTGKAIKTTSAKTKFQQDTYFPKNIKMVTGNVVQSALLKKYIGMVKSFHIIIH